MQAFVSRRRALKGAAWTAALGAVPFSTLRTAVAKPGNRDVVGMYRQLRQPLPGSCCDQK